ncbi:MAG: carbohydrate porin [Planctomycetota bacterium]|nr:carbohydrate porin [Planctomycetota bacterium]
MTERKFMTLIGAWSCLVLLLGCVRVAHADPPDRDDPVMCRALRDFAGFRNLEGVAQVGSKESAAHALELLKEQPGTLGQPTDIALIDPFWPELAFSPVRNLMQYSADHGIKWAIYDTTVYQWANKYLPGYDGGSGINRFQVGLTVALGKIDGLGHTSFVAQGRVNSVLDGSPPLGEQIGSLVTLDADFSVASEKWLRLMLVQELGSPDVLATIGRIDPNDYIDGNPYANDETTLFLAAPLDGSDALPLGFQNYAPGAALQIQCTEWSYINTIITSPVGGLSDSTGFSDIPTGGFFVGSEFGFVLDYPGGGPSRIAAGGCLTNVNAVGDVLSEIRPGAWVLAHAELRPDFAAFAQWSYADPLVTTIQNEAMAGVYFTNLFGSKGAVAVGLGGGTSWAATGGSQDLIELFVRTQLTPSIQFTVDFQFIPKPINAPTLDDVFVVGLRTTVTF